MIAFLLGVLVVWVLLHILPGNSNDGPHWSDPKYPWEK